MAAAQDDDQHEDIFYLRTVMGKGFTPGNLPLLTALSNRMENEGSAASDALKGEFKRPRPYQFDRTLHPVCETVTQPNSYPSGHSIVGYLDAFILIRMVPEKSREILERADDFAHNRMVCGVHYPSDLAAGREVAYVVFGYLMAQPRFQSDLAAAAPKPASAWVSTSPWRIDHVPETRFRAKIKAAVTLHQPIPALL